MHLIDTDTILYTKDPCGIKEMDFAYRVQIENLHTVDAVNHAKIIETIENGQMKRIVSCCGANVTQMTCWVIPDYCPWCGAKLDLQED